jgi:hypothetical protein
MISLTPLFIKFDLVWNWSLPIHWAFYLNLSKKKIISLTHCIFWDSVWNQSPSIYCIFSVILSETKVAQPTVHVVWTYPKMISLTHWHSLCILFDLASRCDSKLAAPEKGGARCQWELQGLKGIQTWREGGIVVWQGLAMDFLKLHLDQPSPTLLHPVGEPSLKTFQERPTCRAGGLQPSSTLLDTPHHMPMEGGSGETPLEMEGYKPTS